MLSRQTPPMSAAFSRIVKFVNPSFFSRWAIATPAKPAPMITIDGSYARQAVAKLLLMRQRRLTSRCGGRGGVGVGALPVRTLSPDFRGFKEASRSMNRVSGFGKNPEHSLEYMDLSPVYLDLDVGSS